MLTEITSQAESNNKCRGSANSIDSIGAGCSRSASASSRPGKSCMQVPISSPAAVEDDPRSTSLLHRSAITSQFHHHAQWHNTGWVLRPLLVSNVTQNLWVQDAPEQRTRVAAPEHGAEPGGVASRAAGSSSTVDYSWVSTRPPAGWAFCYSYA